MLYIRRRKRFFVHASRHGGRVTARSCTIRNGPVCIRDPGGAAAQRTLETSFSDAAARARRAAAQRPLAVNAACSALRALLAGAAAQHMLALRLALRAHNALRAAYSQRGARRAALQPCYSELRRAGITTPQRRLVVDGVSHASMARWAMTRAAAAAAALLSPTRATADAWFPLDVVLVGGNVAVASTGVVTPMAGAATDNAVHAVRPADWNAASAAAGLLVTLCRLADIVPAAAAVVATEKAMFTAAASRCRPDSTAGASLTAVMLTALATTDKEEAIATLNAAACAVPNVEAV